MAYTEEELFDMSDDELRQAMKEERADDESLEQPTEEDSVHNTDTEDEVSEPESTDDEENLEDEDTESEEDGEDEEDESDDQADDDNSEESTPDDADTENTKSEDSTQEKAQPKVHKFKANGQEFEFTEEEIIQQFDKVFGQAMNYTKKMQAIAPHRKMISALEEAGLKEDDVNLMIDAMKGNKDAITVMLEKAKVDILDLADIEDNKEALNYKPTNYGRDEVELQLLDIVDEIKDDKEFPITQHVISNQWDDASKEVFAQNPGLVKELHYDVVNGVFDKVNPVALKLKVLDGGVKSDIQYYVEAAQTLKAQERVQELERQKLEMQQAQQAELERVKAEEAKRNREREASRKRKAATHPQRQTTPKQDNLDYLDDSDEAFEAWYKELQERI